MDFYFIAFFIKLNGNEDAVTLDDPLSTQTGMLDWGVKLGLYDGYYEDVGCRPEAGLSSMKSCASVSRSRHYELTRWGWRGSCGRRDPDG